MVFCLFLCVFGICRKNPKVQQISVGLCHVRAAARCAVGNTHRTGARGLLGLSPVVSPVPRTPAAHSRSSLCPELQPTLWFPEDRSVFRSQQLHPRGCAPERATDRALRTRRKARSCSLRGQDGASEGFLRTDVEAPETKDILCIPNISKQSKIPPLI